MFGQFIPQQQSTVTPDFFVGGNFTTYNGSTENRLIELKLNGQIYSGFDVGTGFNGRVGVVRLASDGKIYVGGSFTTYQGVAANYIIRLNPDGSKDTGFDNSTGFNNAVTDIRFLEGKIYVSGTFTTYKGVSANRIICLNANGSKHTGFDNSTGFNANVNQMAIAGDKIYCCGIFEYYKGVYASGVARLNTDGSLDVGFDSNPGSNGLNVTDIAITNDGKIIISGSGAVGWNVGGSWQVARLNTDGSLDNTFQIAGPLIADGPYQLAVDPVGNVYVGGTFTTLNSVPIPPHLVKFNSSGVRDTSFNLGTSPNWGFNNSVWSVQYIQGKVYVGGDFTTYKNVAQNRMIALNADGSKYTTFNVGTGFNDQVYSIGR